MPAPDTPGAEALFEHFAWTRRLALAMAREPHRADDLTQETWLSFLHSPPHSGRPVRPWLSRVMRNAARERVRRDRARAEHEDMAAREDATPSDSDLAERVDLHEKLVQQVMALEPLYRRTILLRFFEGLSAAEIAEREGVPRSTVRTRLRRGIEHLRESLGRRGHGDWRMALLPLWPKGGAVAPAGVLIVGTKSVLAMVVGIAAMVLGLVWWGGGRERPTPPDRAGQAASGSVLEGGGQEAALAPSDPEPIETARAEVADAGTRTRRLRVVRDEDDSPLPGAEVRFVHHSQFQEWRRERSLGGRSDALPCIEALGATRTADEAGVVELPIADDLVWLAGRLGDHFGMDTLTPDYPTDELRLALDRPLRVIVVDPAGEPVSGAAVGLFEFSPRDETGTVVKETFTGPAGMARLQLGDERLPEDSHFRVGLYFPVAIPVEVQVDPRQPPVEPIRLVAPFTGSVRVVLAGEDEEPWPAEVDLSLHAIVPSKTDPDRMVRADRRDYRILVGVREVVFEHVALGIDVHLFVYRQGMRKAVALNHPGPTSPGETVVIRLEVPERYASVQGRFTGEDGAEAPAYLSIFAQDLDNDTRRIESGTEIEPDGSFSIGLHERVPAGARCRVAVQTDYRAARALGAAFEFLAPGPGESVDVGRVVLREASLIVGGTVTDLEGEPLQRAWLQLGDKLARSGGTFIWNFMGFPGVHTDEEGRFEFRGELLPDSYAVHVQTRGYQTTWTPCEFGQSDLRIELAHRGGLVGRLELPPGFPVERLTVAARPSSSEPPDWWENRSRRVGVKPGGGFEIPDLDPGSYEVGVMTGRYSGPLALLGEVEITGGGSLAPEFLAGVDMTCLRVIEIEVQPAADGPMQGLVAVGAGSRIRHYRIQNGSVSLITAQPSIEVTVLGQGRRPLHVPDLRESTRLVLEAGIPVVVTLPDAFTLPVAPLYLEVALVPEARQRKPEHEWVYSRDCAERDVLQSHDLHPSLRFDGTQEVALGAPGPGEYELSWWVVRPGEAGVTGSHISPVRWKPGRETLRVEEAALHLRTQPVQAGYDETVARLAEDG